MKREGGPYVIGLCGRSGAGKGMVSLAFSRLGVPSVDTDAVYREMTSSDGECMTALRAAFGDGIVAPDGSLDRRALAAVVFKSRRKLKLLNRITHPLILAETERRVGNYRGEADYVIVDAPVLFESGYNKKCDCIVAVDAPDEILIKRITERDGIDAEAAKRRLHSQKKLTKIRKKVDFTIMNDGDLASLDEKVAETFSRIRALCERDRK